MPVQGGLSASAKLLIWLGVAGLLVTVLGIVFASPDGNWLDDLFLEVSKAGVQLLAIGVLGGALTYAWKNLSSEREKESERRAKIRAELVELFSLYNDVKSVRRTLRSLGLDPKYSQPSWDTPKPAGGQLTDIQARGFHEQMLTLNSLQLGFEAKKRQFEQTDFLGQETPDVVRQLSDIEHHLNRVLAVWERGGWLVQPGTQIKPVSEKLVPLFNGTQFRTKVSLPLREITRLINKHAFGEASSETRELVSSLEGQEEAEEQ